MPSNPLVKGRRARAAVEHLERRTLLSTFFVTNTADAGAGSLRQAILDSNAAAGSANEIDFAIDPGGPQTIVAQSPLPVITNPLYVNGTSQPGYGGAPLIELSGWGLSISAGQSTIRGLCIHSSNEGALITLGRNGNNVIQGNYLGTDLTGTSAAGNSQYGIYVNDTAGNLIGGTESGQANLISGNAVDATSSGIVIFGKDATGNLIQGNRIGTNASGTAAVANQIGVQIEQYANHNTIGGTSPGAGNLISGNLVQDVLLGLWSTNTTVQGNVVGLNADGTAAVGNSDDNNTGVDSEYSTNNLIGGTSAAARNIISGHHFGVYLYGFYANQGAFNTVEGNYIGTDVSGLGAIPNDTGAVINSRHNTFGGTSATARNVVAGNQVGVEVIKDSNTTVGNYIGVNAAGTALGNTAEGVLLSGASTSIGGTGAGSGNVISGNGNGILVTAAGTLIQGNLIGTDATGVSAIPNLSNGIYVINQSNTTVGGTTTGAGNVISGNTQNGIRVDGGATNTGNLIEGNSIGANSTGAALGNGSAGVLIAAPSTTIGGAAAGGNVIGANSGAGIVITSSGALVQGNWIGVTRAGAALGNAGAGVWIQGGAGNHITANTIAFNEGDGIDVTGAAATGNALSRNLIFSNAGVAIDLGADGPTPNHVGGAVPGPNNLQNHPVLRLSTVTPSGTTITGTFNSTASAAFTLEFFSDMPGSGSAQARTFLGSTAITTDVNGNAAFTVTLPTFVAAGQLITATATDPAGNTSELSPAVAVVRAAAVVGRYAFYNHSSFDGNDPAITPADDNAIAPDKQALLPVEGPATFRNYTSYSKGLNGIMIDVAGLAGTPVLSDFSFLAGNGPDPTQWLPALAPSGFQVRPQSGAYGSTRIEITWADHAIQNQWLAVTINAGVDTGLPSPDVFYFGNLAGESGKPPVNGQFVVTSADESAARNDMRGLSNPAPVTNTHDYNHDGRIDAVDELIARRDQGAVLAVIQPALTVALRMATRHATASVAYPTDQEQYMIELINRARANPASEAAMDGIDLNEGLAPGTLSSDPRQPLAVNPALTSSAESHSQWMIANQTISHDEGPLTPQDRMQNAGYVFNPPAGSGENIGFSESKAVLPLVQTIAQEQRGLFVDSSTAGRLHRLNLLDSDFQEVGLGVATGPFPGYNAVLATQDFAFSAGNGPFLTGVAYSDARIHDHFYEPGEGIGGAVITATRLSDGATFSTATWSSGGYTLPLPAGTYMVTASADLLGTITDQNVTIGAQNVKLDFTPASGPYVAGRYVFYNNSAFNGNTPGPGPGDDGAIAVDKQALLPEMGPATFANYTSYSKGINGIMVDLAGLPAGTAPGTGDFDFAVGNSSDPSTWRAGPAPLVVRSRTIAGGITRVEIIWPDHAIANEWLQVTVIADAITGLSAPDVFYFGNLIGASGTNPAAASVVWADEVAARSDPHGLQHLALITNPHDYNRDGRVDALDQLIARRNLGASLTLINPV